MTGTIGELALTAAFLLGSHFGLSGEAARSAVVARLGERGFAAFYSLVALAALVWLSVAYAGAPQIDLWGPPDAWQWAVPLAVMPLALLLLVGGVSAPNPTALNLTSRGQTDRMESRDAVHGALRITRHPVMWSIGLWGLAHLVPNGDLASLLFFGSLSALALVGTIILDHKNARRHGPRWATFAAATSNLPFAAVLDHRQSLGTAIGEIGWWRLAITVLAFALVLHGHAWIIGLSALPPV